MLLLRRFAKFAEGYIMTTIKAKKRPGEHGNPWCKGVELPDSLMNQADKN
jgi:hypothetical protein